MHHRAYTERDERWTQDQRIRNGKTLRDTCREYSACSFGTRIAFRQTVLPQPLLSDSTDRSTIQSLDHIHGNGEKRAEVRLRVAVRHLRCFQSSASRATPCRHEVFLPWSLAIAWRNEPESGLSWAESLQGTIITAKWGVFSLKLRNPRKEVLLFLSWLVYRSPPTNRALFS